MRTRILLISAFSMIDLSKQRLLVIAPHPDDEVIGCGGLIKKIKNKRGKVNVLYLTVGDTREFSKNGFSSKEGRLKEIKKVADYLMIDRYDIALSSNKHHLKLDILGQKALMEIIERKSIVAIEKVKPTIVAFPSNLSYNQDHRIVAFATHAALRPSERSSKHFVPYTLVYEEVSDEYSLNEKKMPNFFVELKKNELEAKLTAMKLYSSQNRPPPNLRSLSLLKQYASFRGALIGREFAEGYFLTRGII